jgi:hypothetical protein
MRKLGVSLSRLWNRLHTSIHELVSEHKLSKEKAAWHAQIVNVRFSCSTCSTEDVGWFPVRVDMIEEFPFLVTKLSLYFDR